MSRPWARSAAQTSRYSGSPSLPGSLVRSSTAAARTVAGSASASAFAGKGRYSRTFTTPTFSPRAQSRPTVSWAVSQAEPMQMMTRSASGAPA